MTGLTTREESVLAEQEQVVERGLSTFLDVGRALLAIRDGRLYRAEHDTFESYCQDRWGLSESRTYQLIDAVRVSTVVEESGLNLKNEAQARELAPLLDQPERLRETWQQVNEQTCGKPTAAAIRSIVRPPVATVTTTTTETVGVNTATGEVLGPPPVGHLPIDQHPDYQPEPHPLASARSAVHGQPAMRAGRAFDRLHDALLIFRTVDSAAVAVADLVNDELPAGSDRGQDWLREIDALLPVLNDYAAALRRRNLRSVTR